MAYTTETKCPVCNGLALVNMQGNYKQGRQVFICQDNDHVIIKADTDTLAVNRVYFMDWTKKEFTTATAKVTNNP